MLGWPGCCCGGRIIRETVLGCNALPLEGALVEVGFADFINPVTYTSSALTDADGVADVPIPAGSTMSVRVSKATFETSVATVPTGGSATLFTDSRQLAGDATHQCQSWESAGGEPGPRDCLFPLPTPLFLTDSVYGATTLNLVKVGSARWVGSKTITTAACDVCPAASTTVTYELVANAPAANLTAPSFCLQMHYDENAAVGTNCPATPRVGDHVSGNSITLEPTDMTCPPAFFSSHTYIYNPADASRNQIWCSGATFTISQ
jgi:hypothetical protein